MSTIKVKNSISSSKQRRRNSQLSRKAKELNDDQLVELLAAYRKMGDMLEKLVARERLYRPHFIAGLDNALKDVALGRTKEVKILKTFIDCILIKKLRKQ